jgi:hypothetical protein
MARIIFSKIWSVLISSITFFTTTGVGANEENASKTGAREILQLPVRRSEKPQLFLEQAAPDSDSLMMAAHRSHSSHRSHASHSSHASHYSGSSSQSQEPSSTPETRSTPKPTPSSPSITPSPSGQSRGSSSGESSSSRKPSFSGSGITKLHMKNGVALDCDSAWQEEGKMFFSRGGKVYSLPLEDIDLLKTLNPGN